jgi:hypothetical protein
MGDQYTARGHGVTVAEVDYRDLQDAAVDRVWMRSGAQRDGVGV